MEAAVLTVDLTQLETLLVAGGLLLLAGVLGSRASSRFGVPALLFFLGLGMLAGSEGLGGIDFDDPAIARGVGTVALAFILFSGGLDTRWRDVRPVLPGGMLLATVGVVVTAAITGSVAALVLGLPLAAGLLLGAVISSTDAAAVFSILRSRGMGLQRPLRPLLELESGSNDPMAVLLTLALIDWISGDGPSLGAQILQLVFQLLLGLSGGVVVGVAIVLLLRRFHLDQPGLYPVVTVAGGALAYAATTLVGGSGFLAVYVAGLAIGNSAVVHRRRLVDFHDALAWFMQITLFLVLGMLVFPSQLPRVAVPALVVLLALTFVARPVAVAVCLPRGWRLRQRGLISWVGLRGAAPILLATFPLVAGIQNGAVIFDVVFLVVLASVLVQGTTIPFVARRLGVEAPVPPPVPLDVEAVREGPGDLDLLPVKVGDASTARGVRIVDLNLPESTLIVLLTRGQDRFIPQGSTVLEPGDDLLVLTPRSEVAAMRRALGG